MNTILMVLSIIMVWAYGLLIFNSINKAIEGKKDRKKNTSKAIIYLIAGLVICLIAYCIK